MTISGTTDAVHRTAGASGPHPEPTPRSARAVRSSAKSRLKRLRKDTAAVPAAASR